MVKIPESHKRVIDEERYFRSCLLCGAYPEIDHNFVQGKQIPEIWAYAPLCKNHHTDGEFARHNNRMIREAVELHLIDTEQEKREMAEKHNATYLGPDYYEQKRQWYQQSKRYLGNLRSDLRNYLEINNLNIIV